MLTTSNVKTALNVEVQVSVAMTEKLLVWSLMYEGRASWNTEYTPSIFLAAAVAGELARATTSEMTAHIEGSARAEYLDEQMEKVIPVMRQRLEYCLAKGGMIFKPYPVGDRLQVDYVQADGFYPVKFDGNGRITACVFEDVRQSGTYYYTRMEYHELLAGGGYVIKNVAFRSSSKGSLGDQVQLAEVADWAGLQETTTFAGVNRVLFGYCKNPSANHVDTTSPLGVSCYSRAEKLIEQAETIWANLIWEFESGKRAIDVDSKMFSKDTKGNVKLPDKRLFRSWNSTAGMNVGEGGPMFKDFTPEFREAAIKAGFNDVLRQIEFVCGLSYGVISDPSVVAMTATEVVNSKQRYYSTVSSIQTELAAALDDLAYAMDVWATINGLAPAGDYDLSSKFDDSIISDSNAKFAKDTQAVGLKAMPLYKLLMRNYDLSETEAKAWVQEAQDEQPSGLSFDTAPTKPTPQNSDQTSSMDSMSMKQDQMAEGA